MTQKNQTPKTEQTQTSCSISEIDLTNLTVDALLDLKLKVEEQLRKANTINLKDTDLLIQYDVKLVSKEGVIAVNEGSSRMNSIMNRRLIVEAPRRFESEFQHQIFEPIYAEAIELFDNNSFNNSSLANIKQQIGNYELDGLQGLQFSNIG